MYLHAQSLGNGPQDQSGTDAARGLHDEPPLLPTARGDTSHTLLEVLARDPRRGLADAARLAWRGPVVAGIGDALTDDALTDDDLQLAMWLSYELSYRGLARVDDDWEGQPDLVHAQRTWESDLHADLQDRTTARFGPAPAVRNRRELVDALEDVASAEQGPSLSKYLMRHATEAQFREFLIHKSIYHLKEADLHTWVIPRLSGAVKAAMVTIQLDEYGSGNLDGMHAQLFRRLMQHWQVDDRYAAHLERAPAVTLLASNIISMFGLRRRWRGALVGHLTLFEMTSSVPNSRYARGHRRLNGDDLSARFFDEHVVADAVHEQLAAHDLAGGLVRDEPHLGGDIIFGARCAALADELLAAHLVGAWEAGRSSLYGGGEPTSATAGSL